jgi:hypothetical protein
MSEETGGAERRAFWKSAGLFSIGVIIMGFGVLVTMAEFNTNQPEGPLIAWEIADSAAGASPLATSAQGIPVRVQGEAGNEFPVSVRLNDGSYPRQYSAFIAPSSDVAHIAIPSWFSGCGEAIISTPGLPDLTTWLTDGRPDCLGAPAVSLFKQFNLPSGKAPTTSVRNLLIYLSDVSSQVDIERLPAGYRACLESDRSEIPECLALLEPLEDLPER